MSELYYIPSIKTPTIEKDTIPLKGDIFPEEFPFHDSKPHGWAWTKYYRTPRNYIVLPKYCNYVNMEILVSVFNGNIIDVSKNNITHI